MAIDPLEGYEESRKSLVNESSGERKEINPLEGYEESRRAKKYAPIYATPDSAFGELKAGVSRGIDGLQETMYGAGALAADYIGADGAKDYFIRKAEQQAREQEVRPPSVSSYDDVNDFHTGSRYFLSQLGQGAPQLAEAFATGAIGAAMGTAAEPGGGTAVGAVAGFVERQAVKSLIKKGVAELASHELASFAEGKIAKSALSEATQSLLSTEARAIAKNYGSTSLIAVNSIAQESGSIYNDLLKNPDITDSDRRSAALYGGMIAALPDTFVGHWIGSKFFPGAKEVTKEMEDVAGNYVARYAKTYGKEIMKVVPVESAQEYVQTIAEEAAKNWADPAKRDAIFEFNDEQKKNFIDSAFGGGIMGLMGGGVAAFAETPLGRNKDQKQRIIERDILARADDLVAPTMSSHVADAKASEMDIKISKIQQEVAAHQEEIDNPATTPERKSELEGKIKDLNQQFKDILKDKEEASAPKTASPTAAATPIPVDTSDRGIIDDLRASQPQGITPEEQGVTEAATPEQFTAKKQEINDFIDHQVKNHPDKEQAEGYKSKLEENFTDEVTNFMAREDIKLQKGSKFFGVTVDDAGGVQLHIPTALEFQKRVENAKASVGGEGSQSTQADLLNETGKIFGHEIFHLVHVVGLRDQWMNNPEGQTYRQFVDTKTKSLGEAAKSAVPHMPKMLKAVYRRFSENNPNALTIGHETVRMIGELARTGQLTEETQALSHAEREMKNGALSEFTKKWIEAIKAIKGKLKSLITGRRANPEIVRAYEQMKAVLDKYDLLVNKSEAKVEAATEVKAEVKEETKAKWEADKKARDEAKKAKDENPFGLSPEQLAAQKESIAKIEDDKEFNQIESLVNKKRDGSVTQEQFDKQAEGFKNFTADEVRSYEESTRPPVAEEVKQVEPIQTKPKVKQVEPIQTKPKVKKLAAKQVTDVTRKAVTAFKEAMQKANTKEEKDAAIKAAATEHINALKAKGEDVSTPAGIRAAYAKFETTFGVTNSFGKYQEAAKGEAKQAPAVAAPVVATPVAAPVVATPVAAPVVATPVATPAKYSGPAPADPHVGLSEYQKRNLDSFKKMYPGMELVWRLGDVAMMRGYGSDRSAIMSWVPINLKTNDYYKTDISKVAAMGKNVKGFDPDEITLMLGVRDEIKKSEAHQRATNPDGPFADGKRFVATESFNPKLAEYAESLIKMLGLKQRIFLADRRDLHNPNFQEKYSLYGGHEYALKLRLSGEDTNGSTSTFGDSVEDGMIMLYDRPGASFSKSMETIAHEIGHRFEKEVFNQASPAEQKAVRDAFEAYLANVLPGSARSLVDALRPRSSARKVKLNPSAKAVDLEGYWVSFTEWWADQVSRWATTDEVPLTIVDKLFAKIGAGIRRMLNSLVLKDGISNRDKYQSAQAVREFLNKHSEKAAAEIAATVAALGSMPEDGSRTLERDEVMTLLKSLEAGDTIVSNLSSSIIESADQFDGLSKDEIEKVIKDAGVNESETSVIESPDQFSKTAQKMIGREVIKALEDSSKTFTKYENEDPRTRDQGTVLPFQTMSGEGVKYEQFNNREAMGVAQEILENEGGAIKVADHLLTKDGLGTQWGVDQHQLSAIYELGLMQLDGIIKNLDGKAPFAVKAYLKGLMEKLYDAYRDRNTEMGAAAQMAGKVYKLKTETSLREDYVKPMLAHLDRVFGVKKGAKIVADIAGQLNKLTAGKVKAAVTAPKIIAALRKIGDMFHTRAWQQATRQTIAKGKKVASIVRSAAIRAGEYIAADESATDHLEHVMNRIIKGMTALPKVAASRTELSVFSSVVHKVAKEAAIKAGITDPDAKTKKASITEQFSAILRNQELLVQFTNQLVQEYINEYGGDEPSSEFMETANELADLMINRGWTDNMVNSLVNKKSAELGLKLEKIVREGYKSGELLGKARENLVKAVEQMLKDEGVNNTALANQLVEDIHQNMEDRIAKAQTEFFGSRAGVKEALKSIGERLQISQATLGQIAKEYHEHADKFHGSFEQFLVEEYAVPNTPEVPAAAMLAKVMQEQLNKMLDGYTDEDGKRVKGEREKILDRWAESAKKSVAKDSDKKNVEDAISKIIQLANLGALQDVDVYSALQEKFGLPKYNKETAAKIQILAEQFGKASTDRQRDIFKHSMSELMASAKGINTIDLYVSAMYISILSGPGTHMKNIAGNFSSLVGQVLVASTSNPKMALAMIRGIFRAATGVAAVEFRESMFSGMALGKEGNKFTKNNPTEIKDAEFTSSLPEGASKLLKDADERIAKFAHDTIRGVGGHYITRALTAMDIYFYKMSQEAAYVRRTGDEGNPEMLAAAMNSARVAMLKTGENPDSNRNLKRKQEILAYEIYEKERTQGSEEKAFAWAEANREALDATFQQEPKGALGWIATKIGEGTAKYKAGLFIIPFTRVAANVTNAFLEWSPYGFVRYALGGEFMVKDFEGNLVRNGDIARRAMLGTIGMLSLAALLGSQDDEDPDLALYADGPSNKDLRDQMFAKGWKPYSLKVGNAYFSYQYTPMAMAFGMLGKMFDNHREGKYPDSDGVSLSSSATAMLKVTVSQSFLAGLADIMAATDSPNAEVKLENIFARMVTMPIPNLFKQIDKTINPTVYESEGFIEGAIRYIPVVNAMGLNPALNSFGQPIKRDRGVIPGLDSVLTFEKTDDQLLNLFSERGLRVPGFSKATRLGNEVMDNETRYNYVQTAGPLIEQSLRAHLMEIQQMDKEKAQDYIEKIATDIKRKVRDEMNHSK